MSYSWSLVKKRCQYFKKKYEESLDIRKYSLKIKEIIITRFFVILKNDRDTYDFFSFFSKIQTQKIISLYPFFRGEMTFQNVYMNTGS